MSDLVIVTDSREQDKLFSEKESIIKGLKTGDYSVENYEDCFALERKSLQDLFGTLGKGHDRFKKELERAKSLDYFAIIVEGSYDQIKTKKFPGAYHSKMKGYVVASILMKIHLKYGVPVFFAEDKKQAKNLVKDLCKAFVSWKQSTVPSCHQLDENSSDS